LNQAIEHDPEYADAFAGLASVYAAAAVNFASEPLEYASEAKANAAIALRLDPLCSRAEATLGYVDSMVMLDWSKGERELRRAVELMPQSAPNHNWLGTVLIAQGRFAEAIAEQETGESLDPLVPAVGSAFAYYLARRYDDALQRFLKARDLNPDVIAIHPFIGGVLQEQGHFDKAMAEFQLALPKIPDQVNPRIALLLARTGKRDEARKMLTGLEHPKAGDSQANAFDLAAIYAALGDRDTAFQWLDRAYERRIVWPLKVHPVMDPLRGDRRYAELLKKVGLAD
jgi:Tfp pilus assembly protein PilF